MTSSVNSFSEASSSPTRDLNEAESWLLKAAAHDNPFSQYLLGMIRLERSDYAHAAEWFQKAANQGLPQAQQQFGQLLKQGRGVTLDKFAAYMWCWSASMLETKPLPPTCSNSRRTWAAIKWSRPKPKHSNWKSPLLVPWLRGVALAGPENSMLCRLPPLQTCSAFAGSLPRFA